MQANRLKRVSVLQMLQLRAANESSDMSFPTFATDSTPSQPPSLFIPKLLNRSSSGLAARAHPPPCPAVVPPGAYIPLFSHVAQFLLGTHTWYTGTYNFVTHGTLAHTTLFTHITQFTHFTHVTHVTHTTLFTLIAQQACGKHIYACYAVA